MLLLGRVTELIYSRLSGVWRLPVAPSDSKVSHLLPPNNKRHMVHVTQVSSKFNDHNHSKY